MKPRVDLLVVSHACVRSTNQALYLEMLRRGHRLRVITPKRWSDPYSIGTFDSTPLGGMEEALVRLPVVGRGRAQRHFYLANPWRRLIGERPRFVLLEEEPFSLAALQWSSAAVHLGIPFGVQVAENRDRRLPRPIALSRRFVLERAALVIARSPSAAERAESGGSGERSQLCPTRFRSGRRSTSRLTVPLPSDTQDGS